MKVLRVLGGLTIELARSILLILGLVAGITVGLASWAGTPLLLTVGESSHNLTFSEETGLVLLIAVWVVAISHLYNLGKILREGTLLGKVKAFFLGE